MPLNIKECEREGYSAYMLEFQPFPLWRSRYRLIRVAIGFSLDAVNRMKFRGVF